MFMYQEFRRLFKSDYFEQPFWMQKQQQAEKNKRKKKGKK